MDGSRSLADKINHLFETMHPRNRGPYTLEEISAKARAAGKDLSPNYIWLLRKGQRDNPTIKSLEALATAFGVPVAYFFDQEVEEQVNGSIDRLVAMRDAGVKSLALRASGISPEGLAHIEGIIDHIRKIEGLPESPDAPNPEDRDGGNTATSGISSPRRRPHRRPG